MNKAGVRIIPDADVVVGAAQVVSHRLDGLALDLKVRRDAPLVRTARIALLFRDLRRSIASDDKELGVVIVPRHLVQDLHQSLVHRVTLPGVMTAQKRRHFLHLSLGKTAS